MTNILDLLTSANNSSENSSETEGFFTSIIYEDDLIEMIDAIIRSG